MLALLATTFVTLAETERATARNYLDTVRARLVAQSGVEAAIVHLGELLERGTLMTETDWVPKTDPVRVNGAEVRPAGVMNTASHARRGDFYTLRITDSSSQVNVNDGVALGRDHPVSRNLRRLLNLLGAQPSVGVPALGDRLLTARPASGYVDKHDLLRAFDGDRAAFDRAREFLTVRSWSDPTVCLPVPPSPEAARSPAYPLSYGRPSGRSGPLFRYGHQRNADGELIRAPLLLFDPSNVDPAHNAVWGHDSLSPQWIENTARREVLTALLTDLEGFFLVERRRDLSDAPDGVASPCGSPGGAYGWTSLRYRYDGQGPDGGECGYLYRTLPIVGPGGRSRDGIPASSIVDEILACRSRQRSPRIKDLDYAAVPFGGPFRTWSQFWLFADRLVEGGLLADTRTDFFWDYDVRGARVPASSTQLRVASQAIADVLKANFNPNLHLNGINPDRMLFTHVDKTDLLVHSTEFSFTPMGAFEIESVGRIVRPRDGGDDAAAAPDNEAVAQRTIVAQVRLFDAVRETSQAQFSAGTFAPRKGAYETNTNAGVESGPEPDNGPAENGYEGYLRLSTIGSNFAKGERKPAGELWTTLTDGSWYPGAKTSSPGGPHLGSTIHAHFQLDHVAHHHASRNFLTSPPNWDGFRLPQGAWQTVFGRRCCLNRNWEDRTETIPGPYGPVDATRAGASTSLGTSAPRRYGLTRSFSGAPPTDVEEGAPGDLRIDGAYVERGSAFGYWIDESVSFNFNEGTAAFWLKPGFFPEMTGKRRTLLSASRVHAAAPDSMNPSPFALFFVPPQGAGDGSAYSYFGGSGRLRPCSLVFGYGFSSKTGYNWEMDADGDAAAAHASVVTPTLNREGHGDGRRSVLRAHEWTHVAVAWNIPRDRLPTDDSARIYVNGRIVPGTLGAAHLYATEGQPFAKTPRWTTHSKQALIPGVAGAKWCKNSIRVGGEPSMLFDGGLFAGNYTADATFDEFYL